MMFAGVLHSWQQRLPQFFALFAIVSFIGYEDRIDRFLFQLFSQTRRANAIRSFLAEMQARSTGSIQRILRHRIIPLALLVHVMQQDLLGVFVAALVTCSIGVVATNHLWALVVPVFWLQTVMLTALPDHCTSNHMYAASMLLPILLGVTLPPGSKYIVSMALFLVILGRAGLLSHGIIVALAIFGSAASMLAQAAKVVYAMYHIIKRSADVEFATSMAVVHEVLAIHRKLAVTDQTSAATIAVAG